jgi:hypothetical protein
MFSLFLMAETAIAIPTVDGNFSLAEWNGFYSDDNGVLNNGYLDPGYGGQAFDVEYLGLYHNSDKLYFGLQTGFDLSDGIVNYNGLDYYAGDFGLDVDGDSYYDYALDFTVAGNSATFNLVNMSTASWEDVDYAAHAAANPFQADYNPSDVIASFSGMYGTTFDTTDGGTSHVIEGYFDLGLLSAYIAGEDITLHWTMSCGNDFLNQTSRSVPEPSTFLLMGMGLIGFAVVGRRGIFKK